MEEALNLEIEEDNHVPEVCEDSPGNVQNIPAPMEVGEEPAVDTVDNQNNVSMNKSHNCTAAPDNFMQNGVNRNQNQQNMDKRAFPQQVKAEPKEVVQQEQQETPNLGIKKDNHVPDTREDSTGNMQNILAPMEIEVELSLDRVDNQTDVSINKSHNCYGAQDHAMQNGVNRNQNQQYLGNGSSPQLLGEEPREVIQQEQQETLNLGTEDDIHVPAIREDSPGNAQNIPAPIEAGEEASLDRVGNQMEVSMNKSHNRNEAPDHGMQNGVNRHKNQQNMENLAFPQQLEEEPGEVQQEQHGLPNEENVQEEQAPGADRENAPNALPIANGVSGGAIQVEQNGNLDRLHQDRPVKAEVPDNHPEDPVEVPNQAVNLNGDINQPNNPIVENVEPAIVYGDLPYVDIMGDAWRFPPEEGDPRYRAYSAHCSRKTIISAATEGMTQLEEEFNAILMDYNNEDNVPVNDLPKARRLKEIINVSIFEKKKAEDLLKTIYNTAKKMMNDLEEKKQGLTEDGFSALQSHWLNWFDCFAVHRVCCTDEHLDSIIREFLLIIIVLAKFAAWAVSNGAEEGNPISEDASSVRKQFFKREFGQSLLGACCFETLNRHMHDFKFPCPYYNENNEDLVEVQFDLEEFESNEAQLIYFQALQYFNVVYCELLKTTTVRVRHTTGSIQTKYNASLILFVLESSTPQAEWVEFIETYRSILGSSTPKRLFHNQSFTKEEKINFQRRLGKDCEALDIMRRQKVQSQEDLLWISIIKIDITRNELELLDRTNPTDEALRESIDRGREILSILKFLFLDSPALIVHVFEAISFVYKDIYRDQTADYDQLLQQIYHMLPEPTVNFVRCDESFKAVRMEFDQRLTLEKQQAFTKNNRNSKNFLFSIGYCQFSEEPAEQLNMNDEPDDIGNPVVQPIAPPQSAVGEPDIKRRRSTRVAAQKN